MCARELMNVCLMCNTNNDKRRPPRRRTVFLNIYSIYIATSLQQLFLIALDVSPFCFTGNHASGISDYVGLRGGTFHRNDDIEELRHRKVKVSSFHQASDKSEGDPWLQAGIHLYGDWIREKRGSCGGSGLWQTRGNSIGSFAKFSAFRDTCENATSNDTDKSCARYQADAECRSKRRGVDDPTFEF